MVEISFDELRKISGSTWPRKILAVSVELEIYSKIKKGVNTLGKIAESLSAGKKGVERLLNACVSLGLLKKEDGIYDNVPVSEKHLVKEMPEYFGDMIIMQDRSGKKWDLLGQSILNGKPLEGESTNFEDPIFTKAMHSNAIAPARVLSEKINLGSYKKLLDIGGGSGAYTIELTNKNPNLKAVIFELPGVCETTMEYVQELGDAERIEIKEGDFIKDKLPEGYDVVLISHIFHSYSVEECKSMIKRVYDMLPENGMLIINEFLLNKDKTGPVFSALFNVNMFLVSKQGGSYTEEEITSWLTESNFKETEVFPLTKPVTCITAKK